MMSREAQPRNDQGGGSAARRGHLDENVWIDAPPAAVFAWIDDPRNTGWHMSRPSMAMLGSVLQTEQISPNATGLGATYRSHGRVMGLPLDSLEL